MSKFYTMKKGVYPTGERVAETRRKKHAEHLDYFYGDYWSIFVDKDHSYLSLLWQTQTASVSAHRDTAVSLSQQFTATSGAALYRCF